LAYLVHVILRKFHVYTTGVTAVLHGLNHIICIETKHFWCGIF